MKILKNNLFLMIASSLWMITAAHCLLPPLEEQRADLASLQAILQSIIPIPTTEDENKPLISNYNKEGKHINMPMLSDTNLTVEAKSALRADEEFIKKYGKGGGMEAAQANYAAYIINKKKSAQENKIRTERRQYDEIQQERAGTKAQQQTSINDSLTELTESLNSNEISDKTFDQVRWLLWHGKFYDDNDQKSFNPKHTILIYTALVETNLEFTKNKAHKRSALFTAADRNRTFIRALRHIDSTSTQKTTYIKDFYKKYREYTKEFLAVDYKYNPTAKTFEKDKLLSAMKVELEKAQASIKRGESSWTKHNPIIAGLRMITLILTHPIIEHCSMGFIFKAMEIIEYFEEKLSWYRGIDKTGLNDIEYFINFAEIINTIQSVTFIDAERTVSDMAFNPGSRPFIVPANHLYFHYNNGIIFKRLDNTQDNDLINKFKDYTIDLSSGVGDTEAPHRELIAITNDEFLVIRWLAEIGAYLRNPDLHMIASRMFIDLFSHHNINKWEIVPSMLRTDITRPMILMVERLKEHLSWRALNIKGIRSGDAYQTFFAAVDIIVHDTGFMHNLDQKLHEKLNSIYEKAHSQLKSLNLPVPKLTPVAKRRFTHNPSHAAQVKATEADKVQLRAKFAELFGKYRAQNPLDKLMQETPPTTPAQQPTAPGASPQGINPALLPKAMRTGGAPLSPSPAAAGQQDIAV